MRITTTAVTITASMTALGVSASLVSAPALASPMPAAAPLEAVAAKVVTPTVSSAAPKARRTAVSVIANVGGFPLRGARISVTDLDGRRLRIVQKDRTDSGGTAYVEIAGKHRQFVVRLRGGKYGYGAPYTTFKDEVEGIGRAVDIATYVSPETSLAVAEMDTHRNPSVRKATRDTMKFLRFPASSQPMKLGSYTDASGVSWRPERFLRLGMRNGGPVQYADKLTDDIGQPGTRLADRKTRPIAVQGPAAKYIGGLLKEGLRSWFTGGIGNLLSAGLCATGAGSGSGWLIGIFADCGGEDGNAEINDKLDRLASMVTELLDRLKVVQKTIDELKASEAWTNSDFIAVNSKIGELTASLKILQGQKTGVPGGMFGKEGQDLCNAVYAPGPRGQAVWNLQSTPSQSCGTLYDFYADFTRKWAGSMFAALSGIGLDQQGRTLIPNFQTSVMPKDRLTSGRLQLGINDTFASLLAIQQQSFVGALAWARFREDWTKDIDKCEGRSIPDFYPGGTSESLLKSPCDLTLTAWYQLSVELQVVRDGANQNIDQNVLIDPNTGFSWWSRAFDATGYTLRKSNPARPFFNSPDGVNHGDVTDRLYGSILDSNQRTSFALGIPDGPGKGQHFAVANTDQVKTLKSSVEGLVSSGDLGDRMRQAGFQGPGTKESDPGSLGMSWTRLATDLGPWKSIETSWNRVGSVFTYPSTTANYTHWGVVLNDKKMPQRCDTSLPSDRIVDTKYLWPVKEPFFRCESLGWEKGENIFRDDTKNVLKGIWARTYDGTKDCPRVYTVLGLPAAGQSASELSESLCVEDTYGLVVDPTDARWGQRMFNPDPGSGVAAAVMPGFVSVTGHSGELIRYEASASQNYPTEEAEARLQCSDSPEFKDGARWNNETAAILTGTEIQSLEEFAFERPETYEWCRIRVSNRGGDRYSGAVHMT